MTDTTTQPDTALVSWMYRWRRDNPSQDGGPGPTKVRTIHAWLGAHGFDCLARSPYGLRELVDAYDAAQKPVTVADIPAGEGTASLYIGPDPFGEVLVWEKTGDGTTRIMLRSSRWTRALWEHLAATLPTVTDATEEA